MGDSLERVRLLPAAVRQKVGFEVEMIQYGSEPTDWKPFQEVGPGVKEIRIQLDGELRVFFVTKFRKAIYVLHVF